MLGSRAMLGFSGDARGHRQCFGFRVMLEVLGNARVLGDARSPG